MVMNLLVHRSKLLVIRKLLTLKFKILFKLYQRSYGKLGENIQKYSKTVIGDDCKLQKMQASPFYQTVNFLTMENGDTDLNEISMKPKKVYDDKPVPMAAAILSNSKLHFLKFIYNVVYKYFIPGAFKLCYCDTDSIAIGILLNMFLILFYLLAFTETQKPFDDSRRANMASVLLPVIKPDKVDEFLMIWDLWFVLDDTVEDEKTPGKLKS